MNQTWTEEIPQIQFPRPYLPTYWKHKPTRRTAMIFSGLSERTIHSKFLPDLKRRLAYHPKFKTYSVSFFSGN